MYEFSRKSQKPVPRLPYSVPKYSASVWAAAWSDSGWEIRTSILFRHSNFKRTIPALQTSIAKMESDSVVQNDSIKNSFHLLFEPCFYAELPEPENLWYRGGQAVVVKASPFQSLWASPFLPWARCQSINEYMMQAVVPSLNTRNSRAWHRGVWYQC